MTVPRPVLWHGAVDRLTAPRPVLWHGAVDQRTVPRPELWHGAVDRLIAPRPVPWHGAVDRLTVPRPVLWHGAVDRLTGFASDLTEKRRPTLTHKQSPHPVILLRHDTGRSVTASVRAKWRTLSYRDHGTRLNRLAMNTSIARNTMRRDPTNRSLKDDRSRVNAGAACRLRDYAIDVSTLRGRTPWERTRRAD